MKKSFKCLVLLSVAGVVFAQEWTVSVTPFDAARGISRDDAETVFKLFVAELKKIDTLVVVDRSGLDIGKIDQLGKLPKANAIVSGQLMSFAGEIVLAVRMMEIETRKTIASERITFTMDTAREKIPELAMKFAKMSNEQ